MAAAVQLNPLETVTVTALHPFEQHLIAAIICKIVEGRRNKPCLCIPPHYQLDTAMSLNVPNSANNAFW